MRESDIVLKTMELPSASGDEIKSSESFNRALTICVYADALKSGSGSCKPFIAPFAVFLNENDKNYGDL